MRQKLRSCVGRVAIAFFLIVQFLVAVHGQQPDGRAIFNEQCVACHQAEGQGIPGQFPPLAHNLDLFLARDFPARVVLFGLSGKIRVAEQIIDGVMPPLDTLKDDEIAAVVNYVRNAWGNDALSFKAMQPVNAAMVASLRKTKDADQVYAYRKSLKAEAGADKK